MDGLIARDDPDEYLCSCGQKIRVCGFWQSVTAAMSKRGCEFDVAHFDTKFSLAGPKVLQYIRYGSSHNHYLDALRDTVLYAWPTEKRVLQPLVRRNKAFVESVLEVTGKEVFVDTSKDRLRLRLLRRFSEFDVRAVHLVRDVRGVAASRLHRGRNRDARSAARQWVKENRKIETALRSLPRECVMQLRYEDVCKDVHGSLRKLYRFFGVDPGFVVTDFRAVPHHIIGNKMRLGHKSEISLDERWERMFTPDQLHQIHQVAHKLERRYGYL
jgi:hypothetical protein